MGEARADIEAIREFRLYLVKFREAATMALGDADSDINKYTTWLEVEQQSFWTGQIRKRQDVLARAEEALRFKRLYRDSTGTTPSAVEEMKAVTIAKKNLQEAQQKLANVKSWCRKIQKEIVLYRGGTSRFAGAISSGVPAAIAQLATILDRLDQYVGMQTGAEAGETPGIPAGVGTGQDGAGGMARPAEPEEPAAPLYDPHVLRTMVPSDDIIAAAKPFPPDRIRLECANLSQTQQDALAEIVKSLPEPAVELPDTARVVLTLSAATDQQLLFVRLPEDDPAWYIGPVDIQTTPVYNTARVGDLRTPRPELAELMKMPPGTIAVLDKGVVVALFNLDNDPISIPPA